MSTSKRLPKGWQPDRYADHVKINEDRVPESLRHLVPYAKYWSVGDDVDRAELMARTSKSRKKALVDAVWPKLPELRAWCESNDWSDEGVIFTNLIEAAAEARVEICPPPPAAQQPPNKPELPLSAEQRAELQGYINGFKNHATGDRRQDAALLRDALAKIDAFWTKVLAEHPPGQSRERILEYLGRRDPVLPPKISKELIEIRGRIDTLLAQSKPDNPVALLPINNSGPPNLALHRMAAPPRSLAVRALQRGRHR